jgi:flagellar hook assembly protein FlgD
VASIARSGLSAGRHSLEWNTRDANGRSVPAGVYFYRVEGSGVSKTHKLTVVR